MLKSPVLLSVVCTSVGFVAATLLMSGGPLTVHADCPGELPCQNGDVNADGRIDLSDAVYLLNSLFLGGPAPVEIECPPCDPCDTASRPLKTGQTRCYDSAGNIIDCFSEQYPGQDGLYQTGSPVDELARFADNADGTVTDMQTELLWTKAAAGQRMNWQQALLYCENLILCDDGTWLSSTQTGWVPDPEEVEEHGGILYDDWRLPNVTEIHGLLLRYSAPWNTSAFPAVFELPPPSQPGNWEVLYDWVYWSSSTYEMFESATTRAYAWAACYNGGVWSYTQYEHKTYAGGRVLAVRGGL